MHTLIKKLLQTKIPGTSITFIVNYIKGRNASTTYRNHILTTSIPKWSSTRWFRSWSTQMMSPSHLHSQARGQPRHTYNHTYIKFFLAWTKQINLTLNPDKSTCILFTPDPAEYKRNLDLKINNTALHMAMHPKVLGLTLDPKLTCSTHIHNISVQAHKPLQMIKTLTATGWGEQKETLMATYKAVMRPALEYAFYMWSPLASSTSINKLQVMQNAHKTQMHMHDEILMLPIHKHLVHALQYKQKTQHSKFQKPSIFNNDCYTTNIPTDPHTVTTTDIKKSCAIFIHLLSLGI